MSRTRELEYEGVKLFFTDYSHLKTADEFFQVMEASTAYIRSQPPKSVYSLSTFENVFFNMDIAKRFQERIKGNESFIAYSAITGITGLLKIMASGVVRATGRDLRFFDTLAEAREFLIQKALEEK